MIVGIDTDSDFPPDVVAPLPKLGRDLDLDVEAALALNPDLVLTSLTVPGHERIVEAFQKAGVRTLVCDPVSLEDVFADIQNIANAVGVADRGTALTEKMRSQMPVVTPKAERPRVLLEWWPKPVIAPARQSWATDLIHRAGGRNPWADEDAKSVTLTDEQIFAQPPDCVVMSWCGVKAENYRPEIVSRREAWSEIPAVSNQRIIPVTEAYLGRPGPRLVEGYRALRAALET